MGSLLGKVLKAPAQSPPIPLGSPRFSGLPGGSLGSSDRAAYLRAYTQQGTLFSNVSLLASATAGPIWKLFRSAPVDGRRRYTTADRGSDQRTEITVHAALSLLYKPNPFYSRFRFFELSQLYQDLAGECYWVIERDPRSSIPLSMWTVRPDRMEPVPDPDKYLLGWVYTAPDGREKIPLDVGEVIFNPLPNPLDPYRGAGPVQAAMADIEGARYASDWNAQFFLNSAEPGGVIQVEQSLEEDEWESFQNRWREAHRGVSRAHRVAVLEAGMTWVPNAHTPRDMDFANLATNSRDFIREALGMHKVMTGVTADVNRANAQTGEEVFASWKVAPRLDRWRDCLNNQLLPMFGSTGENVEFDYVYPMPENREQDNAEMLAKSAAAQTLVGAGWDPAEVLHVVGLPDMKWNAPAAPGGGAGKPEDEDRISIGRLAEGSAPLRIGAAWQPSLRPQAKKDAAAKVYEQESEDYPPHAMAWMHHADWKGPVKVPLDHIQPDMKWMDGADPKHVQEFVHLLKQGKKLKPVVLVATPSGSKLHLIDGHHRYLASAEMNQPVRGFIATVDADHGPWESMHEYQLGRGPERGSKASARDLAIWNSMAGGR